MKCCSRSANWRAMVIWTSFSSDSWFHGPGPFCSVSAYIRDASGAVTSVKGVRLNICDVAWHPPHTKLARKILAETVQSIQSEKIKSQRINGNEWRKTRIIRINIRFDSPKWIFADEIFLDIPATEPWFDQWRETFLSVQPPTDHEFTRHFLSCLIVLSSSDPNPLDTANALTRKVQTMQSQLPPKLPKWFTVDTLNCYVLLHDRGHSDLTTWVFVSSTTNGIPFQFLLAFSAVHNKHSKHWNWLLAKGNVFCSKSIHNKRLHPTTVLTHGWSSYVDRPKM